MPIPTSPGDDRHAQLKRLSEHLRGASEAVAELAALEPQGPQRMRTLGDYAERALAEAGGALTTSGWADSVRQLGYRPRSKPQNPRQLEQSLSSLPHYDESRFVRVGRGLYDLAERHPEGGPTVPKTRRNPPWSDEELTLALDLYLRRGQSKASDPEVLELSRLLNRLSTPNRNGDAKTFRNPNGVAMKLGNFSHYDPAYPGDGLSRGNRREEVIWEKYANDPEALKAAVQQIHERL